MGSKKRPFYRFVAADSRYQRDGRFLEICGYYDPKEQPYKIHVDREKILDWLSKGAQMSHTVESLLRKEGIVQDFNREKEQEKQSKKTPQMAADAEAGTDAAQDATEDAK